MLGKTRKMSPMMRCMKEMDDHLGGKKGSDGMQWIDSPASASHTHLRALSRREWV